MTVVLQTFLVAYDLAVELVHKLVDGGVHVFGRLFDEDVAALDVQRHLGLLAPLFLFLLLDREQHCDVDHLVEVSRHAFQLGEDVFTQGRGDFEMVSADRQVHRELLLARLRGPEPFLQVKPCYYKYAFL